MFSSCKPPTALFFSHGSLHTRDSFNQAIRLNQSKNTAVQLDKQLYFQRAFIYFAPLDALDLEDKQRLTHALYPITPSDIG
ncbi:hypothetical protein K0I73_18505 [Shewanella mesophila]|uniref:hypothetical protein n=1 Tax=Shewanella mesophila TaxID=2864208 RepID=UPI001C658723|nr:hypothetical protein [Shewanella mesophila]QYJ86107.1 hypothetical protein K0I73_18505 [Shewanella mesophila]